MSTVTITAAAPTTRLHGWGYEGRTVDDLIRDAHALGVTRVVDVRLNAVSRRKGFSKRALAERLAQAGVEYLHLRDLGNPRDNRAGFAQTTSPAARQVRDRYSVEVLGSESGQRGLRLLMEAAPAIVLCFEADERCCHRSLVLEAVRQSRPSEEAIGGA